MAQQKYSTSDKVGDCDESPPKKWVAAEIIYAECPMGWQSVQVEEDVKFMDVLKFMDVHGFMDANLLTICHFKLDLRRHEQPAESQISMTR